MLSCDTESSVLEAFVAPIKPLLEKCESSRNCPVLEDWQWITAGISRVISQESSGRGFLQQLRDCAHQVIKRSNYFLSLSSKRRLGLIQEVNTSLVEHVNATVPDELAQFEALAKYEVFAGDGHYRAASTHEQKVDGKKYAVGHFYTLNLRTHALTHLDSSLLEPGRKKEHDMHMLKRMSAKQLRQGAPKGRRVIYVWDCAGIDFRQWFNWKQASGIYFISLEKGNMKLEVIGEPEWDKADPINAGVIADELMATSTGVSVRRVRYQCPRTGKRLHFITNVTDLPPGLIAHLYKMRWDIEKVYDQLKNKLCETKAWAKSQTARNTQAAFTCIVHNLMILMEQQLREQEDVVDQEEKQRRKRRIEDDRKRLEMSGQIIPLAQQTIQRASQRSLKFIRWLRNHWWATTPWSQAVEALRIAYGIIIT